MKLLVARSSYPRIGRDRRFVEARLVDTFNGVNDESVRQESSCSRNIANRAKQMSGVAAEWQRSGTGAKRKEAFDGLTGRAGGRKRKRGKNK